MKVFNSLICIPDISGYTKFMSDTELQLSTKVISSLLNEIIYANTIGLKVSEIEGDAVLFYKIGNPPSLQVLLDQCKLFHHQFYQRIKELRMQYKENEDSEKIPELLGLKIVLHYGEVGMNEIGKRIKLIGEDVIIAHRLLKNSIPHDEYILISGPLMDLLPQKAVSDSQLNSGSDHYDHIGVMNYGYLTL